MGHTYTDQLLTSLAHAPRVDYVHYGLSGMPWGRIVVNCCLHHCQVGDYRQSAGKCLMYKKSVQESIGLRLHAVTQRPTCRALLHCTCMQIDLLSQRISQVETA